MLPGPQRGRTPAKPPAGPVLLAKDSSGPRRRLCLCNADPPRHENRPDAQADCIGLHRIRDYFFGLTPRCAIQAPFASVCQSCAEAQQLSGGAEEIRTPDLRRAKAALSQLSYGPFLIARRPRLVVVVSWDSLRQACLALSRVLEFHRPPGPTAAISLAADGWWAMVDSNHRPRSYQDRALTS